jgi:hypothetical protein
VPEELGPRVFERSVSGAQSSGLGLALARTLVVADGGRLELVSARPAVFAMFLPAGGPSAAVAVDAAADPAADAEPTGEGQAEVAMAASSAASVSSGNTQRR